jgi:hypothetical protein
MAEHISALLLYVKLSFCAQWGMQGGMQLCCHHAHAGFNFTAVHMCASASMDAAADAAYGSLLGACVGDAAGAVLEFIYRMPTEDEVRASTGHWPLASLGLPTRPDDQAITVCSAFGRQVAQHGSSCAGFTCLHLSFCQRNALDDVDVCTLAASDTMLQWFLHATTFE